MHMINKDEDAEAGDAAGSRQGQAANYLRFLYQQVTFTYLLSIYQELHVPVGVR